MAAAKKKIGRPRKYTTELGIRICEIIASSEVGINKICKEYPSLPCVETIREWRHSNKEFSAMYARAKSDQMDYMAESILDIADDGRNDLMTVKHGNVEYEQENKEVSARSKLRVETRKWLMAKLAPNKYGDKIDITSGEEPLKSFAPQIIIQKTD